MYDARPYVHYVTRALMLVAMQCSESTFTLASSPGHSQLFVVSREKWEGLGGEITCVTLPVERR